MKVTYLLMWSQGMGGTERSIITQAGALAERGHDVTVIGVIKDAPKPFFEVPNAVRWEHYVDVTGDHARVVGPRAGLTEAQAAELGSQPSRLVPREWEAAFSALTDDVMLERFASLNTDVLVTTSPALMALAVDHAPDHVVVVHQEHRTSELRGPSKTPLLVHGPRLDALVFLTQKTLDWFAEALGAAAPRLECVVNPLVPGYRPHSRLTRPLLVTAGRLTNEKQHDHLIKAFSLVAEDAPEWTLRIFGDGPNLGRLRGLVSSLGLNDRVELAGRSDDMASEWAKASLMALSSKVEGLPLVIQEAMAAGLPVVSYDSPNGPAQLVENEASGLIVRPGDIQGFGVSLLRLMQDHDLLAGMGAVAQQQSGRYAADRIAARWESLFDELVQERDAMPRAHRRVARVARAAARRGWVHHTEDGAEGGPIVVTGASDLGDDLPATGPHGALVAVAKQPALSNRRLLPREVLLRNLDVLLERARVSGVDHVVIPPVRGWAPTLVVRAADRHRFLEGLPAVPHPGGTYVQVLDQRGRVLGNDLVADLVPGLLDREVSAVRLYEAWSDPGHTLNLREGYACEVQFWEQVDDELVPPRANEYVDNVPVTDFADRVETTVHGRPVPTLSLMSRRTFDTIDFPIDAVYTWVDGQDPAWLRSRVERLGALGFQTPLATEADSAARYRSRDELRYSLRSLEYFAPWVNHIYLVTAGQRPAWLDDSTRVTVVDHRDIFAATDLPTFNSHAIESRLHHIPGLSEHFVYFNDDCMLGRPVTPHRFFRPSGEAAVFRSPTKVGVDVAEGAEVAPHLRAALNNRALLENDFGRTILRGMLHTPHPMRRSVLQELEDRYPEAFARTAASPFRSDTDVSVASSLFQHYALATGAGFDSTLKTAFIGLGRPDVGDRLRNVLRNRGYDAISIGDYHEYAYEDEQIDEMVRSFLDDYFPLPAALERAGDPEAVESALEGAEL